MEQRKDENVNTSEEQPKKLTWVESYAQDHHLQNDTTLNLLFNGELKNEWLRFYDEAFEIARAFGYEITHVNYVSEKYESSRTVTVKRKGKFVRELLESGDVPRCLFLISWDKEKEHLTHEYNVEMIMEKMYDHAIFLSLGRNCPHKEKIREFIPVLRSYVKNGKGRIFEKYAFLWAAMDMDISGPPGDWVWSEDIPEEEGGEKTE